jgi:hypothetical protein
MFRFGRLQNRDTQFVFSDIGTATGILYLIHKFCIFFFFTCCLENGLLVFVDRRQLWQWNFNGPCFPPIWRLRHTVRFQIPMLIIEIPPQSLIICLFHLILFYLCFLLKSLIINGDKLGSVYFTFDGPIIKPNNCFRPIIHQVRYFLYWKNALRTTDIEAPRSPRIWKAINDYRL